MNKANMFLDRMQLHPIQKALQHACPTLVDGIKIDADKVETGTLTDLYCPDAPGFMFAYIISTPQSIAGNI